MDGWVDRIEVERGAVTGWLSDRPLWRWLLIPRERHDPQAVAGMLKARRKGEGADDGRASM